MLDQSSSGMLKIGPQLARTIRVFRVSRLFRLVKSFNGLQSLIQTLLFCVPSLLNVASLLLLIFFIYAVLGVFLFHSVNHGDIVDEFTNFHNFGRAMITLLRVCTGEEWNEIMFDCSNAFSGAEVVSKIFFTSFIAVSNFVMLNMFIMVIINLFEEYHINPDNILNEWKDMEQQFQKQWSLFTVATKGQKMHSSSLYSFFVKLEEPLGFNKESQEKEIIKQILQMEVKADEDGFIYYNQLLFYTMRRVVKPPVVDTKFKNNNIEKMENQTLGTINMMTKKNQKKSLMRSKSKMQDNSSPIKYTANPFISSLYRKKTFKHWRVFAQQRKQKKLQINQNELQISENSSDNEQSFSLAKVKVKQTPRGSEQNTVKFNPDNPSKTSSGYRLTKQKTNINHVDQQQPESSQRVLELTKQGYPSIHMFAKEKFQKFEEASNFNSAKNSQRLVFQETLISEDRFQKNQKDQLINIFDQQKENEANRKEQEDKKTSQL